MPAALALVLALASLSATAQSYPAKPVRMIVPAAPGGVTDTLARLFGHRLTELWAQPLIVENRSGGGQIIGADLVAKAPADGYTLPLVDSSNFVIHPHLYCKLPYDTARDFTSVEIFCQISPVLAVNAAVPATNVRELIALTKAKPGSLYYATPGNGTYSHIAMEQFNQLAGVNIVHVPYKGAAPGIADLVSAQVQIMILNTTSFDAFEKAGKVRVLAAATAKPPALRPALSTVSEAALPGFETGSWFTLFGPGNLPRDIVNKVHGDVTRIIAAPGFKEQNFVRFGLEQVNVSDEELLRFIKADSDRWGPLVKASGAKVE